MFERLIPKKPGSARGGLRFGTRFGVRVRVAALIALLAFGLLAATACGGGAGSGGGGDGGTTAGNTAGVPWDTKTKDKVIVSVINPYYTAGWQANGEAYMKLHSETEIVVDVVASNDDYLQKVTTWASSGDLRDAADIVHINFAMSALGGYDKMWSDKIMFDFTDELDKPHPYLEGNAVWRTLLDQNDIRANVTDKGLPAVPFDKVGVATIYNKTMLDENGIAVPTSVEQWLAACQKLVDVGVVKYPIGAAAESEWYVTALADAALRDREYDFLVQPDDFLWSERTEPNRDFKFDENDWSCDQYTVPSTTRIFKYQKETNLSGPIVTTVWEEFAKLGKYFNENFVAAASNEVITSFEMENSAFILSGSWNVGSINKDLQEMGDDAFEWGTLSFLPYENPPAGFRAALRTLYVNGNTMGILLTQPDNEDHLARVLDFYKYVYTPSGGQTMYEATLNAGHFVQGPSAIKGVTLSEDLNKKLEGFVQTGAVKADFGGLVGQSKYLQSDLGEYQKNMNNLMSGVWDAETFVKEMNPIWMARIDDDIRLAGSDLDPATEDVPPK